MKKVTIEDLIKVAKETVAVIAPNTELVPTLMVESSNPNGEEMVVAIGLMMEDGKSVEQAIKYSLRELNVSKYVLVMEGYGTTFTESATKNYQGQVRNMPPEDRFDVACITAVEKGKSPTGFTARIDPAKTAKGKRTLREWDPNSKMGGRLTITDW